MSASARSRLVKAGALSAAAAAVLLWVLTRRRPSAPTPEPPSSPQGGLSLAVPEPVREELPAPSNESLQNFLKADMRKLGVSSIEAPSHKERIAPEGFPSRPLTPKEAAAFTRLWRRGAAKGAAPAEPVLKEGMSPRLLPPPGPGQDEPREE